jgi:hypothetical protein
LYDLCKQAELIAAKRVTIFTSSDDDAKKKKIRQIEYGGPGEAEEPHLCTALALPDAFLRDFAPFGPEEAARAADQYWRTGTFTMPLGGPAMEWKPRSSGFQRVLDAELRPAYRARAFADFAQVTEISAEFTPVLFVIEGRKGVGKTFLVSQCYWSATQAFPNALLIDCSDLSLDQIFPAAFPFFASDRCVPATRGLGCLLVLDGLQVERGPEGTMIRLPNRLAHVGEVVETINRIWREIAPVAVILVVENNERPLASGDVFARLAEEAGHIIHRLEPLDEEAGAAFLLERGLDDVSEADRRMLSTRLHGLPIALTGAVEEIRLLDTLDREAYLTDLASQIDSPRPPHHRFQDLFVGWLGRLGEDDVDHWKGVSDPQRAHPHALLRLLAILSGPVTYQELEEIIAAVPIPRVSGRKIDYLKRGELPFVTHIDDTYDLHMMVRQALRRELRDCVERDEFDAFTNRSQLEAIHWQAAKMRRRSLARERHADANCVGIVEAFVYHMIEQIRLIPKDAANRRMVRPVRVYTAQDLNAFESAPGKLANGKLWYLAFHEARRFLVDSQKASTRVHGQFEAKARILSRLIAVATEEDIAIQLVNIDVPKETAICWMHAGRLQLALQAISHRLAERTVVPDEDAEAWLRECNQTSVEVAIRLRLGQVTDQIEALLKPLLEHAIRLALRAVPSTNASERMPVRERGALRVLSRAAEVAQAAGKDALSLALFEQAVRLRACWYPRLFNGEAARHYAVGLVRATPDAVARARALVVGNIEAYGGLNLDEPRKGSNDIVGFMILEAGLARFAGEYPLARMAIARILTHPFVRRREITFATRAEFELEMLRLDFAESLEPDFLLPRARQFSERMKAADHLSLHLEAEILVGELLGGVERERHCERLRVQLARLNHRMRERDIDLLLQGESPTRILGF